GSPEHEADAAELRRMTRAMAGVKVVRHWMSPEARAPQGSAPAPRPAPASPIQAVAMAASTGGPAALRRVLEAIPRGFPAPILSVQAIARDVGAACTAWLGRGLALPVRLAVHGEPLSGGHVYVAPDDRHLGVGRERRVELSSAPHAGGFRPAANHLFASAAD